MLVFSQGGCRPITDRAAALLLKENQTIFYSIQDFNTLMFVLFYHSEQLRFGLPASKAGYFSLPD